MSGFKNAPSITEFKVGMVVLCSCDNKQYHVEYVDSCGCAHCSPKANDGALSWFYPSQVEQCTLDLDSVWVGRRHRNKLCHAREAVVLAVCGDQIGFNLENRLTSCWPRERFLDTYERIPIPLPEPPVKVGDVVRAVWQGESYYGCVSGIGTEARFRIDCGSFGRWLPFDGTTITHLVVPKE